MYFNIISAEQLLIVVFVISRLILEKNICVYENYIYVCAQKKNIYICLQKLYILLNFNRFLEVIFLQKNIENLFMFMKHMCILMKMMFCNAHLRMCNNYNPSISKFLIPLHHEQLE